MKDHTQPKTQLIFVYLFIQNKSLLQRDHGFRKFQFNYKLRSPQLRESI
jgi:hypothetical protein